MSVIVRDLQTEKISILCKGADSIIKKLLATSGQSLEETKMLDRTQKYVDIYAEEGLRTLLLAKKELDNSFYQEWNARFKDAAGAVVNKDELMEKV